MRFIDEAVIRVSGGHGGPGCVSFRREAFAPRGGPDGGDGGAGGSVVFVSSSQLGTLQDFRFKRNYQAQNGASGSGANKAGKDGESITLRVPVGTVIKDAQTQEVLMDFGQENEQWIACEGGRGGKGNTHFTSSTHQAPKFAQPGEKSQTLEIQLELKLIADVGIIGFPNTGKSTLISRISAARPKIADYPFTTLTPNLGVVCLPEHQSFVVADIPGLVKGAHRGVGLGHRFLKHIERTRLFIHLLDASSLLERMDDPIWVSEAIEALIHGYVDVRTELGLFNEKLLHKPEIIVINKIDLLESNLKLITQIQIQIRSKIHSIRQSHPLPDEPFIISAVSGTGIELLLMKIYQEFISKPKGLKHNQNKTLSSLLLPDDEALRN